MKFSYKAIDSSGAIVQGVLESSDKNSVQSELVSMGLKPVSVAQLNDGQKKDCDQSQNLDIGEKLALPLFKKLLQLCGSGAMPVSDALKSLSLRSLNAQIKGISKILYKDLSEGRLLATSLERFPKTFDKCVCHLVEAGEATANLPFVFQNIIKYLEDRQQLRKTIVSALAYPVFLCAMATGVVMLFLFFMLPRIKTMMSNMGAEENFPIKMMDFIGAFFTNAIPTMTIIGILLIIWLKLYRRTKNGLVKSDKWFLKIPIIKEIIFNAEVSRFSSLSAALLASGVNSSDVFYMAEKSIKNEALKLRFRDFRTAINDGVAISLAMQKYDILSSEDIDIISVGEKTGSLVQGFSEIAKIRADDLEKRIKLATAALGAIALLSAFILVFIFAMGIVLSILGLSQSIAG